MGNGGGVPSGAIVIRRAFIPVILFLIGHLLVAIGFGYSVRSDIAHMRESIDRLATQLESHVGPAPHAEAEARLRVLERIAIQHEEEIEDLETINR